MRHTRRAMPELELRPKREKPGGSRVALALRRGKRTPEKAPASEGGRYNRTASGLIHSAGLKRAGRRDKAAAMGREKKEPG